LVEMATKKKKQNALGSQTPRLAVSQTDGNQSSIRKPHTKKKKVPQRKPKRRSKRKKDNDLTKRSKCHIPTEPRENLGGNRVERPKTPGKKATKGKKNNKIGPGKKFKGC